MKFQDLAVVSLASCALFLTGCATVPLADTQAETQAKSFSAPENNMAALYIYRDSFVGKGLKKDIFVDGKCVGESADRTFFYQLVEGGKDHAVTTESEFSPNKLSIHTEPGKNYFIRQYIKMGVFVGGANVESVSEEEGKRVVSKDVVRLAQPGTCSAK
ncbi:DUF2846 domain-containing protein [Pseudaeromonas sharmana]|uniref:DUF2846 domain-containing protein n=1 Tax=Pseudaeromonas sharmana TaxID=328412 RepID=A0ABV8CL04_9GAMM